MKNKENLPWRKYWVTFSRTVAALERIHFVFTCRNSEIAFSAHVNFITLPTATGGTLSECSKCCDSPWMSIDSSWRIRRISLCVTHTVQTTLRPASHVCWISTNIIMALGRKRGSVLCILSLPDSGLPNIYTKVKKRYRTRCPLINCLAFILLFMRRSKSGKFYHMH